MLITYDPYHHQKLADGTYAHRYELYCAAPRCFSLGKSLWFQRWNGEWIQIRIRDRYNEHLSRRCDLSQEAAEKIIGPDYQEIGSIEAKVRTHRP